LYEGKRTLMLIHVREHVDRHELRRVDAFLERERGARVAADVEWILNLMRARGSLAHGVSVARQLAGAAKYEFTRSFGDCPRSEHTAFVEQLVDYVVQREL
jgi:geranylgeranyl diphosphate synthase, type II